MGVSPRPLAWGMAKTLAEKCGKPQWEVDFWGHPPPPGKGLGWGQAPWGPRAHLVPGTLTLAGALGIYPQAGAKLVGAQAGVVP